MERGNYLLCFYFIVVMLCVPSCVYSQIDISFTPPDLSINSEEYDSLEDISFSNYKKLQGQTLYLKPNKTDKLVGCYPIVFYDHISSNSESIYKRRNDVSTYTNYDAVSGKYYYVNGFKTIFKKEFSGEKEKFFLELEETDSHDDIYVEIVDDRISKYFSVVGYITKMKEMHVGREYVTKIDNRGTDLVKGLCSFKDGKTDYDIKHGEIFKCTDVSFWESTPIYVYENNVHGKCFIDIKYNNYYMKDVEIAEIEKKLSEESRKEIDKQIEKENAVLIAKYGRINGNLIIQGKVKIGFTKAMCIESWGEPKSINNTIGKYGTNEQWVYEDGNYLYFENGKLTTIQTHK